mmetsp:Transcript_18448/g.53596  ORF Transcript_18448/g.53596 Transcript_18448/m.53596 type:complete len:346 (+) Transcript_18448:36-1073(+)
MPSDRRLSFILSLATLRGSLALVRGHGETQGLARKGPDERIAGRPRTTEQSFEGTGDVCMRSVGKGSNKCVFISKTLCNGTTKNVTSATGAYAECLRPRETCAVVGSSVHLLDAEFGAEIDSHDVVIRINGGISGTTDRAVAKHVGNKTTARFVNGIGLSPATDASEGVCHFHNEPHIPRGCGWMCWQQPAFCNRPCEVIGLECAFRHHLAKPHFPMILNHADNYLADRLLGKRSRMSRCTTTGFKAVAFALRTCERVRVYGFGPACNGTSGGRFYDPESLQRVSWHFQPLTRHHYYTDEFDRLLELSGPAGDGTAQSPARFGPGKRARSFNMRLPSCLRTAISP